MGMDSQHQDVKKIFRDAMAILGAGVNVITTDGSAGRAGLTATAVVSITDTPPTMMISVNRNSAVNAIFKENGTMAVNILSAKQQLEAEYFGGLHPVSMDARFARFSFEKGELGLPLLTGALAQLEGHIIETYEVGTHTLFILELFEIRASEEKEALIYFNRAFYTLKHPS